MRANGFHGVYGFLTRVLYAIALLLSLPLVVLTPLAIGWLALRRGRPRFAGRVALVVMLLPLILLAGVLRSDDDDPDPRLVVAAFLFRQDDED